jgi:hypothetical protein
LAAVPFVRNHVISLCFLPFVAWFKETYFCTVEQFNFEQLLPVKHGRSSQVANAFERRLSPN